METLDIACISGFFIITQIEIGIFGAMILIAINKAENNLHDEIRRLIDKP